MKQLRGGFSLLELDTVDSTNEYLKRQGGQLPDKTVVLAHRQTAGKGRLGRSWQSERGESVTASWLFCSLEPQQLQWLPLAAGMALYQSLEGQLGQQTQRLFLKWPNDLVGRQADGSFKKLAGILCESRCGERSFAVCGIGVNLHQPPSFFEQAGLPDAGSVFQVFCCVPDAYGLLEEIGVHLQNWLLLLKAGPKPLLDAYSARCITLGRQVCICREGQAPMKAKAIRIDSDGQLVCLTQTEEVKVRAGEVSVRGLYGYAE